MQFGDNAVLVSKEGRAQSYVGMGRIGVPVCLVLKNSHLLSISALSSASGVGGIF